ncbi:MAG: electron transport complex subunit RsxC [Oscillospiraceae bacterium]|nr:electron transport complex subunit RsxC [Oscillospiraceae bacterium]
MKKICGLPIPHFKNTAGNRPEAIPTPPEVTLNMKEIAGDPARLAVSPGDSVAVGQVVGVANGARSSPVHASISGVVKSISEIDPNTGKEAVSVTITSDGKQSIFSGITPPKVKALEQFLVAVQDSGVIGLGGGGYPTSHKLTLKASVKLDYILINGAECEPYITTDTRTMLDNAQDVVDGALLMQQYLDPGKILICIENNKPEAIKKLQGLTMALPGISVRVLPANYPQGERKILVYNVTGRIVPEGRRLPDVGCVVINCTTVAVFAQYIKTGMPLVSRCVTVDGSAVNTPKNVIAPIGTPIGAIFDFCGGLKEDCKKILMGGAMMGKAVPNLAMPTLKITGALIALSEKDARPVEPTACIKCGRCVSKCPMGLMPSFIEDAFEMKNIELLKKYKAGMCAECSSCAYLCPSKRPLAQVMSLAKEMIWKEGRK